MYTTIGLTVKRSWFEKKKNEKDTTADVANYIYIILCNANDGFKCLIEKKSPCKYNPFFFLLSGKKKKKKKNLRKTIDLSISQINYAFLHLILHWKQSNPRKMSKQQDIELAARKIKRNV